MLADYDDSIDGRLLVPRVRVSAMWGRASGWDGGQPLLGQIASPPPSPP